LLDRDRLQIADKEDVKENMHGPVHRMNPELDEENLKISARPILTASPQMSN